MKELLPWLITLVGLMLFTAVVGRALLLRIQAKAAGVPVPGGRILRIGLFRLFATRIVQALILAHQGSVEADVKKVEKLAAQGGHPLNVVIALIASKEAGLQETFDSLADRQRKGEDLLQYIRSRVERKS